MIENIGAYSQVDYDRGYQQGRADAVDETLEDLRKWLWKNDKCAYHYLNDYYIKPKREQLKEQTNE